MLQKVTVTNYVGENLELSMFNPGLSGFYIKSIDGLGPAQANISTLDIVSIDGSIFNNARLNKRNIVMTLGAFDSPDVESLRQKTYKYFPIKRKLKLTFETDNKTVTVYGYVESNEPDIFSKDVTMKISIICPTPYFANAYENSITFSGDSKEHVIMYEGDIETGMNIKINCSGDVRGLRISNKNGDYFAINDSYLSKVLDPLFTAGDVININTKTNEKSLILTRNDENKNILNGLDRNSKWLKIGKGNNRFIVSATSGLGNMFITMSSPILYEGI